MELAPIISNGFREVADNLSEEEQMFLYQLEVVGLPAVRAAEIAGVSSPYALLKKPHIVAGREQYRAAVRGRTDFTRDDIIAGFKVAIDQANVLGDPMAQIAGWRRVRRTERPASEPICVLAREEPLAAAVGRATAVPLTTDVPRYTAFMRVVVTAVVVTGDFSTGIASPVSAAS